MDQQHTLTRVLCLLVTAVLACVAVLASPLPGLPGYLACFGHKTARFRLQAERLAETRRANTAANRHPTVAAGFHRALPLRRFAL